MGEKKKKGKRRFSQCSDGRSSIVRELKLVHATRATCGYRNPNFSSNLQEVGDFSYTGSFSLKGRKWPYGTAPTMGLSFRTLGLFLDSSGLGCEGRYLGRLWVSKRIENAFRAGFGSRIIGKCILDFVCYFPKAKISGLSPNYWPGLCGLFLVCYCWKLNNMLNVLKKC